MIGKCGLCQYRQSLAFVNTVRSFCFFREGFVRLDELRAVSFENCHCCILSLTYLRLYKLSSLV